MPAKPQYISQFRIIIMTNKSTVKPVVTLCDLIGHPSAAQHYAKIEKITRRLRTESVSSDLI